MNRYSYSMKKYIKINIIVSCTIDWFVYRCLAQPFADEIQEFKKQDRYQSSAGECHPFCWQFFFYENGQMSAIISRVIRLLTGVLADPRFPM